MAGEKVERKRTAGLRQVYDGRPPVLTDSEPGWQEGVGNRGRGEPLPPPRSGRDLRGWPGGL